MDSRLGRVRRAMIADGVDALIVLAPDSQYWLCGLESFISGVLSQALIVPADDAKESMAALVVTPTSSSPDPDQPVVRRRPERRQRTRAKRRSRRRAGEPDVRSVP